MKPVVSIITASYNSENFIKDSIDGVFAQNYPKDRINYIIVDGNSKDRSPKIIDERIFDKCAETREFEWNNNFIKEGYLDGIRCCRISLPENKGPSYNRNEGFQYIWNETDIFAILDSDDVYLPNKISRSVNKWLEVPEAIAVIYADYIIENADTKIKTYESKEIYSKQRLNQECLVHSNSLISKKHLEQALENPKRPYREDMRCAEDWFLWCKLSQVGMIAHIPEALMAVKVHSQNSTSTVPKEVWHWCWQEVQKEIQRQNNE